MSILNMLWSILFGIFLIWMCLLGRIITDNGYKVYALRREVKIMKLQCEKQESEEATRPININGVY
jgi:hypothetical protein